MAASSATSVIRGPLQITDSLSGNPVNSYIRNNDRYYTATANNTGTFFFLQELS